MLFKPYNTETKWKNFPEGRPQVTVSGFAVTRDAQFPILWRTDKVRSAKNCWSIPSGLHEVGLLKCMQFSNELEEELGLLSISSEPAFSSKPHVPHFFEIGSYENIVSEDGWHWCIDVMAMPVMDTDFINKEPDKHDPIKWCSLDELFDLAQPSKEKSFHPSFSRFAISHKEKIIAAVTAAANVDRTDWFGDLQ